MKKLVKKILPLLLIISLMLSIFSISAYAAGSSISLSKGTLAIGETFTVTARFSASQAMYGLEGFVTYDPSVIQYVSGGAECNKITDGKVKIVKPLEGTTSYSTTLNFKSLTAGVSSISVEQTTYVAGDTEEPMAGSTAKVTVTNPSTAASNNANLKSLKVSSGTLTPAFSKDVTSYSVTIPNDKTELLLSVAVEHPKATYIVEGSKTMKVGANRRVVVVTAENGAQKRYTVNITRLDAGGQAPIETVDPATDNKLEVIVGEKTLYVEENFSSDLVPDGFKVDTYVYKEKEVPCVTDDNVVMLYLSNPETSVSEFYVVKDGGNEFIRLIILNVGGVDYYILPFEDEKAPEGYTEVMMTIEDEEIPAYKSEDAELADFVIFYAKGPSGEIGFYRYDTVEKTMQRAVGLMFVSVPEEEKETDASIMDIIKNLSTNGIIVIVCVVGVILLLLAAIIVLIVKIATAGREEVLDDEDDPDAMEFAGFNTITEEEIKDEE